MHHPEIFAHSPGMQAVLESVRRAAATHGGVLVCGESGSGRRMIAREVHRVSSGGEAPFVCADCGEVEEIESVLFGIPAAGGSGDGDRSRRDRISKISLLHQAVGGTLFLAHLTEMPARVQARLARVLRDGEVTVVESRRTVPTRMRIIASADASWDGAVAEGQIRGDLSKRCSQTRIAVPPLRERREDIPALIPALLEEVCGEAGVPGRAIDESAMSLLCAFPWRGNARELRALLHTLVRRSDSSPLRLEDVLAAVHLDGAAKSFLGAGTLREAKERFERDYILAVLERHRGRVGEAARALGIQRPNLYRKMRALRVSPPRTGAASG
jgi:two-component system, NtrC family, nitrogen regulation response regulator NtrX